MRGVGTMSLLLATGCGEDPTEIRILDDGAETTSLVDHPRGSLHDLDGVRGDLLTFWTNTDVDIEIPVPLPRDGALDAADFLHEAEVPRAAWADAGGTAFAEDFDTLAMFTAHARLEEILAAYADLGVREEVSGALDVHYAVTGMPKGNAAYHMAADALLLLRPSSYEELPLSMNQGVLAHEIGHRMQYWELWGGEYFTTLGSAAGTNEQVLGYLHLLGLGEGLSDYHGAVISGDANFLSNSVAIGDSRDLRVPKKLDPAWLTLDAYLAEDTLGVDAHAEGAVIAAALWAVGESLGHDVVSAAVLEAQRNLAPAVRDLDYALGDYEVEMVRLLGPEACPTFVAAFDLVADRFDAVCP